jgi:hypothetical protein
LRGGKLVKRLFGINGTGRIEAAMPSKKWRQEKPIKFDQVLEIIPHFSLPVLEEGFCIPRCPREATLFFGEKTPELPV